MNNKMGESRDTVDFWGNHKTEHFGSDGSKVGESRDAVDFWGNHKTEHFGPDGSKVGESRDAVDFWGNHKTEHFGPDGSKVGESRDAVDFWGNHKAEHFGPDGSKVGESRDAVDFFGNHKTEHFSTNEYESEKPTSFFFSTAGAGDLLLGILFGVPTLFLIVFILLSKFPILELSVEIFLYICAVLYFIKWRRHKRTGNEADKPSSFLRKTTKILIILGIAYLILTLLPLAVEIIF